MINKSPYDKEIKELETTIAKLAEELKILQRTRAEYHCPFKVGDTLTDKNGNKAVLTRITPDFYTGYDIHGSPLKKDGNPSKFVRMLYNWDSWRKE